MEGSCFFDSKEINDSLNRQSLWQWIVAFLFYLLAENTSLRRKVEELEQQNGQLRQQAEALDSKLNQDSTNSNRPPSSDNPYKKPKSAAPKIRRKPGAQKGHPGHRQKMLEPTRIENIQPPTCECGSTEFQDISSYHVHQQIELPPIEMEVTHFVLHQGRCTQCGKCSKARIPEGHETGYGPRMTALVGELSIGASRERVQTFCRSVLGVDVSRGAIQKMVDRVSQAILPYYEAIGKAAREAKINWIDETPWYQQGVLMWLWVMVNPYVAFFKVTTSRSKEAFETVVEKWAGILVSDGYGVYRKWVNERQTCLAHLIRAAKGLSGRASPEISKFGTKAMSELQRLVKWAHAPPTVGEVRMWYARLRHLIARHRDLDDDAGRFARRLERGMGHLWVFLLVEGVEPTNNRAERALRFAVLWRKVMQGTSSEKGDRWAERILSLRETCRLRGISTYEMLVEAVSAHFKGEAPDLSWIDRYTS